MQYQPGYPKTMVSPAYRPAIISDATVGTGQEFGGRSARFLPQMVHTPEEEDDMRARGYLDVGEPPSQTHFAEYPKILRHPKHSPATKATQRSVIRKVDGEEQVTIVPVPAKEEEYPDKTVGSAEEEEYWRGQGWAPAGEWDPAAFEAAHTVPDVAYDPQEWPKWVPTGEVDKDGKPIAVLMEDPDAVSAAERARQAHEYPKWVNGRRVESASQEAALANGEEVLLDPNGSVSLRAPYVPPPPTVAPQPVLDVAALKAEIIGELRDVIREALKPAMGITSDPIAAIQINAVPPSLPRKRKREFTPEERKARGARMAEGRRAARARREAQANEG